MASYLVCLHILWYFLLPGSFGSCSSQNGATLPFWKQNFGNALPGTRVCWALLRRKVQSGRSECLLPQSSNMILFCPSYFPLTDNSWLRECVPYHAWSYGKGKGKFTFLYTWIHLFHLSIHLFICSRNVSHSFYEPGIIFGTRNISVNKTDCPQIQHMSS